MLFLVDLIDVLDNVLWESLFLSRSSFNDNYIYWRVKAIVYLHGDSNIGSLPSRYGHEIYSLTGAQPGSGLHHCVLTMAVTSRAPED